MVFGATQYTFSAEQQERVLMSRVAIRMMNDVNCSIMSWNGCRREIYTCVYRLLTPKTQV